MVLFHCCCCLSELANIIYVQSILNIYFCIAILPRIKKCISKFYLPSFNGRFCKTCKLFLRSFIPCAVKLRIVHSQKSPEESFIGFMFMTENKFSFIKKNCITQHTQKSTIYTFIKFLVILFVNFFVLTCSLSYYRNKKIILYVKMNGIKSNATIKSNDGKKFESRCTPIQF